MMLLINPSQPEQERELEQQYLRFAQANSLTMKQCLVLGLTVTSSSSSSSNSAAAQWTGEVQRVWKVQGESPCQQHHKAGLMRTA